MSENYIEDNGDEFPINNLVRCGQIPYKVDFEGAAIDDLSGKSKSSLPKRIGKTFLPKAIHPSKQ